MILTPAKPKPLPTVEETMMAMIDSHGDRAVTEAWHITADNVNSKDFDYWYDVATRLQALEVR